MSDYIPGLAGIPAAESSISFVDGDRGVLEYRGINVTELVKHSTFEEVCYLLLWGSLPTKEELATFTQELAERRDIEPEILKLAESMPRHGHPMNALQSLVSALGTLYPARDVESPRVQRDTSLRLIAQLPTLIAFLHRRRQDEDFIRPQADLSTAENFLTMLRGSKPDPVETKIFDAALILHADHTLNASTFTARVIGSTLSDGFSVVAGALGSLFGRLHGGANEAVLNMLDDMENEKEVRAKTEAMIAAKQKIMGVGHRVYKVKDPRAYLLQELAENLFEKMGSSPLYERARVLEDVVNDKLGHKKVYPNVDFYSGIVYDRLAIPRVLFTPIFALSRVSGWCAHWMEQLDGNRIFRPRQVYLGEHNVPYVPIGERE